MEWLFQIVTVFIYCKYRYFLPYFSRSLPWWCTAPSLPLAVQIQEESVERNPPESSKSTQEVIRSVLLCLSAQVRVSLIPCASLTLSTRRRGSLLWLLWPLTTVGDSRTPQGITGLPRSHTTFRRLAFLPRLEPCFGLLLHCKSSTALSGNSVG